MNDLASPWAPSRIRGIIFDFDGLIVDTESAALESWEELYAEHGCEFAFDLWAACLGGSGKEFDACAHLQELAGVPLDHDELRARRAARKLELAGSLACLPGVLDYVEEARRLGLKLALASSSPQAWLEAHLARLDLNESFDCIVSADDVTHVKPNPEIYETALARLGLLAYEAVALEDSPNGISAAKAAGIFCIAVPNAVTGRLSVEHADVVVPSLSSIPLRTLLEQVSFESPSRASPL